MTNNPMHNSPRCGARTRNSTPCKAPAVKGKKRCRMHGGNSPGAPKGNKYAWKHGRRSAEYTERHKRSNEVVRAVRELLSLIHQ